MVTCVLCVCVCVSLPWPICTGSVMLLFSPVIILQLSGRLCCLDFSLHVCSSSISVRFLQVTKCCYTELGTLIVAGPLICKRTS